MRPSFLLEIVALKLMIKKLVNIVSPETVPELDRAYEYLESRYPPGEDPWGLNLKVHRRFLSRCHTLYRDYFKVRVFGKENVEDRPYMITANHTGQVALDGMLVDIAFLKEINPPRVVRPMLERFMPKIPFVGTWCAESGGVLGDRENCRKLLKWGESVLVFPEGVRGINKPMDKFYELQDFTRGFYRLAASARIQILPTAVVGAEEFFPLVVQAKFLGKYLGIPSIPLSPSLIPLPSPVDIHIGKPHEIPEDIHENSPDEVIDEQVALIEQQVKDMIISGLKTRREFWGSRDTNEILGRLEP